MSSGCSRNGPYRSIYSLLPSVGLNFSLYAPIGATLTNQNPSQPPRRRRRKPPRQQARDRSQAEQMLTRYDRLLDQWLGRLAIASKKIETYRKKVAYYRARVAALSAAELAALEAAVQAAEEHAGRALRHIELGEGSWESVPSTPSSPSSGSDHAAAAN